MNTVFLRGRNRDNLLPLLARHGIPHTDNHDEADLVLCYGGDGGFLQSEREIPGKLKFPVRDVETAPLCPVHSLDKQLELLKRNALGSAKLPKLLGIALGRSFFGLNDIFIHNKYNKCAMRYEVRINDALYGREIVGDGVGVSTVHGSTAYYRSITHSVFRTGIGLAFSNSTELVNHMVLPEDAVIRVRILRGPAELVADNAEETLELNEGDFAEIRQTQTFAQVLGLDIFMCPDCRKLRHDLRDTARNGCPPCES